MADIRPFRGLRFNPARVALSRALCPPYDVIGPKEARRLRKGAFNAIHLELPAGRDSAKYRHAARTWEKWRSEVLSRDPEPSIYVCEQRFQLAGRRLRRLGLLAAVGVAPPAAKAVLRHERTLSKPKADRLRLLRAVGANLSPIFGIFPDSSGGVRRFLAKIAARRADGSGTLSGVGCRLWRVLEPGAIGVVRRALAPKKMLIADGHHRFEVSRTYWKMLGAQSRRRRGSRTVHKRMRSRGAETILAYLCPEEDKGLVVLPTHRVVKSTDLSGKAASACRLIRCRSLGELRKRLVRSRNPYAFGFCEKGFILAEPRRSSGCRSGLCVEWVERFLLRGVPRGRLSYTHDAGDALAVARRCGGTAVLVKPFRVSDIGRAVRRIGLLPPKSTYFYPKVPAGLVFKEV